MQGQVCKDVRAEVHRLESLCYYRASAYRSVVNGMIPGGKVLVNLFPFAEIA
jgi:hypothetical protein